MRFVVGVRVGGKFDLCCAVSGSVTSVGHHDPDVKLSPQTAHFFPYNVFPMYEFAADFFPAICDPPSKTDSCSHISFQSSVYHTGYGSK